MATLIDKPLEIARDHFLFKFDSGTDSSVPGQFASIRISKETNPLLRRPFSIFNHDEKTMELVVKVVGKGTKLIKDFTPGPVDIHAPLGRGFTICENKNILLVGGGGQRLELRGLEAVAVGSRVLLQSDSRYLVDGITRGWAAGWRRRGWKKSNGQAASTPICGSASLGLLPSGKCSSAGSRGMPATGKMSAATSWPAMRPPRKAYRRTALTRPR